MVTLLQHFQCDAFLIPEEHLLHLVDVVLSCSMVVIQNGLFPDSVIHIRLLQKLFPSLTTCTIAKRRFEILVCLFKACFQFPHSFTA